MRIVQGHECFMLCTNQCWVGEEVQWGECVLADCFLQQHIIPLCCHAYSPIASVS
jgi:hypothetical protein